MPEPSDAAAARVEPDLAMLANAQLHDRGPRYTETPRDPYAPDAPFIAEPWNAVTASFFIFIAAINKRISRSMRSGCPLCQNKSSAGGKR